MNKEIMYSNEYYSIKDSKDILWIYADEEPDRETHLNGGFEYRVIKTEDIEIENYKNDIEQNGGNATFWQIIEDRTIDYGYIECNENNEAFLNQIKDVEIDSYICAYDSGYAFEGYCNALVKSGEDELAEDFKNIYNENIEIDATSYADEEILKGKVNNMNNNQNGKLNNSANQDVSYKWQDPIEQAQEYANEQMEDYGKENLLYDNDDLSITYRTDHIDEISIQNKTNKSIEFVYVNDDNNSEGIIIPENTSVSLCETELSFNNICAAVRNQTFSYDKRIKIEDFRKENVLSTEEIISQIFDDDNERVEKWLNVNFEDSSNFTRNHKKFGQVYGDTWDGIEIQVDYYLQNIKRCGDIVDTLSDEELDELCTLLTDEIYAYHEQPKLTLKEALEQTGRAEFDISDTVFDSFCVAFVYDTGAKELLGEDDYNKVLGWMAENIEVKSFDDGTAECKVSDFIEKNYELFKNFCTEHNNDYYQMDRKDIDTNIEIALATIKSLVVGGYGDKAYSELANEIEKDKNEPSHEDEER